MTSTDSALGAAIGKVATAVAAPRRHAARRSILEELWGEVQGASARSGAAGVVWPRRGV